MNENSTVKMSEGSGCWTGYTVRLVRFENRKGDEVHPFMAEYAKVEVVEGPRYDVGKTLRMRRNTYLNAKYDQDVADAAAAHEAE